ncbi:hypothetical protein [Daejeonella sp.]|uniref:hypothetical protein n=1 Tax=Daejeonella sp. TaxID=2805397 RepID=UPI0037838341
MGSADYKKDISQPRKLPLIVTSLIERLSISYLKSDANLNPLDIDFIRLEQIKTIGKVLVFIASLLSIYMGYLILENWFAGILLGLCFIIIYLNFYLVLLSTIRKSDFINNKKAIVIEKTVSVKGVNLIGDLKTYDDTSGKKTAFFSIALRLLFLVILSSFLSISAVLVLHQNVASKGVLIFKEESTNKYVDFLEKSYKTKQYKNRQFLKKLEIELSLLNIKKDSISGLLNSSPKNESLIEDMKWVTSDIDGFKKDHQEEIVFLRKEINRNDYQLLEKTEEFKKNIENSLFFIQRIKFLLHYYSPSFLIVFIFSLGFFCLPFFLRLMMLRSAKYTMDDKLENFTKSIIEKKHTQLVTEIEGLTKDTDYKKFLSKYHLSSWPLHNEHFEDPPFNTLPKLDGRIKYRKGSLSTYLRQS